MRCGVQEKENVNQTDMVIGNLGHEIGTGISGGGTVEHGGCCLRKMGVLVRDEARRESRQTKTGEQWQRECVIERRHGGPGTEEKRKWEQVGAIQKERRKGVGVTIDPGRVPKGSR